VSRERLLATIAQSSDPSAANGHEILYGVEAAALLGIGDGSTRAHHDRLRRLEALGLLHPVRAPSLTCDTRAGG